MEPAQFVPATHDESCCTPSPCAFDPYTGTPPHATLCCAPRTRPRLPASLLHPQNILITETGHIKLTDFGG